MLVNRRQGEIRAICKGYSYTFEEYEAVAIAVIVIAEGSGWLGFEIIIGELSLLRLELNVGDNKGGWDTK